MMMKLKAIDELNGATVQGRAIGTNLSPSQKRRSFNNNSRGGDSRGGYGGEIAVVEKTVVVETEEILISHSITIKKKVSM
jgi:hypothetical protein